MRWVIKFVLAIVNFEVFLVIMENVAKWVDF